MTSAYNILFTIELMHEYFVNGKCNDFEIIPADDCRQISRALNILCRNSENRLIALIKQNDEGQPFINIPPEKIYRADYGTSVLRFYLKVVNPLFLNYTNIDPAFSSRRKFYFSNLAENNVNGVLNLTTPVQEYANSTQYVPGNLVRDLRTGNIFEAIRKHTSKKKSELADNSLWAPKGLQQFPNTAPDLVAGKSYAPGDIVKQPDTENVFEAVRKHSSAGIAQLTDRSLWMSRGEGQLQYATANDLVECTNGYYFFQVPDDMTTAQISILGFNYDVASPAYNIPVVDDEIQNFEKPAREVRINLDRLKPGKYEIKVNKEKRTVYYDPAITDAGIFGVIEIFNHLPASHDYSLLTNDEKIKNTKYQVQFATRRVLWKYTRKDGRAQTITDAGSTGYEFSLKGDDFVSLTPIPLSEGVLKTLTLEFNTRDFKLHPLPNPPVNRFGKCTQNDYDYMCSEMFLNY